MHPVIRNNTKESGSMANYPSVDQNNNQLQMPTCCRLLYVVGQLGLGGLERQLYYLLTNLDHARYRPVVVVWNLNPRDKYYRDFEALQIPIYGFPADWTPFFKLKALRILARQISPEVIHSYGFHTNFAAYYAAGGIGAVAIGSLRGDFVRAKQDGGFFRGMVNARWPLTHIVNSQAAADTTNRATSPFVPKKVFVIRNGLDLERFRHMDNIVQKRGYIAAVGSLLPIKRWDRLLRVIQKVTAVGKKDVFFQIAGDGPLRPALEKLAGDLGVSGNVQFQGAINDISGFLNRAKFLVHTSESEGCPNAVMEAMACGLPVVAMEAGDIPCLVEHGKTGFVVSQGDEATFVRRVSELLNDDELCLSMGLAAREKAKREFTLERLVSETLAVYRAAGWRDEREDDRSMTSEEIAAIKPAPETFTR
jgi:glycosyltransferase involved in cell wall biosynthesis